MLELEKGKIYIVKTKDGKRNVRRIFKWTEQRFKDIPCYVFTSEIKKGTTAFYDEKTDILKISGKTLPASELSIPFYDLRECKNES